MPFFIYFLTVFGRLKAKLLASANGMNSPEWDQHGRLVDQLSADQDAAEAEAVAAASGPALASASATRGRSHSRNTRSVTNDESRSRSRSFSLPLRGWGGGKGGAHTHGERRQRWFSHDSDTYRHRGARVDTDIEGERHGEGVSASSPLYSGSGGISGSGVGGAGDYDDDLEERPSRNKSFFGGFGKWGSRRRREVSPAEIASPSAHDAAGAAGDSGDEGTMGRSRGGSAPGVDSGVARGGGEGGARKRRGSSSAARALRGVVKRSESSSLRNNRFSSFTGERPHASPYDAAEPLPPPAAVTSRSAPQKLPKARTAENLGRSVRSHSMVVTNSPTEVPEPAQSARNFGGKKGWGRGSKTTTTTSAAAAHATATAAKADQVLESRRRIASTGGSAARVPAPLAETPRDAPRPTPSSVQTPGRSRWGRGRVRSSAGVEGSEEPHGRRRRALSSAAAAPAPVPRGDGGGSGGSGAGAGATTFDDSSRSSSVPPGTTRGVRGASSPIGQNGAAVGGKTKKGVFNRTKGVWGSLQVGSLIETERGRRGDGRWTPVSS